MCSCTEVMLTIEPPSLIRRAALWASRKLARTSMANVRSKSSAVSSRKGFAVERPALFTRTSMRPSFSTVSATRRSGTVGSARSP
jgi:hypothetical protein